LLAILVVDFEVRPADIDERQREAEPPEDYVLRLAVEKACAIAGTSPGKWVIGSDTEVVLEGMCLGKPRDQARACDMLRSLSGRSHKVYSSVALVGPDSWSRTALSVSEVRFATLPEEWIRRYAESGDPLDKAGGYAIQGEAAAWIANLDGSYSGVVGLPLFETAGLLRDAGLFPD
jgi:septum formation protein